ncbi:hypothetical protein NE865_07850 [Phthorimaea operculella]|nr:hypothetical protein NE865_07850 [Phthorimaea operculella]
MGAGVFWLVVICGAALTAGARTEMDELAKVLKSDEVMDVTDFSIYYDLKTNKTIKDMMPRPWYWPGWMLRLPFQGGPCECQNLQCMCCTGIHVLNWNRKWRTMRVPKPAVHVLHWNPPSQLEQEIVIYGIDKPRPWYWSRWMLRLPFQGGPCECQNLQCMCCTGIHLLNWNRKSCANITFNPEESTIGMEVIMQNSTVYKNKFSARNPPPFCIPIPVPYLPPGLVDMCIRLFNVTIVDQRLHVCMDIDSRLDKAPVLVLHFDCMDMGFSGINYPVKPGGSPSPADATMEPEQVDSDIFDPVTEAQKTSRVEKWKTSPFFRGGLLN